MTNVESMTFSLDGLAKKIIVYTILDPITKKIPIPIPVPNSAFCARRSGPSCRLHPRSNSPTTEPHEPAKAIQKMLGMTFNARIRFQSSGTLDVVRYGRVLRSRMLVGVRGAGIAYDGLYYVNSVTHNIKRGEYKQSFQLSRDGLISLTPKVPV